MSRTYRKKHNFKTKGGFADEYTRRCTTVTQWDRWRIGLSHYTEERALEWRRAAAKRWKLAVTTDKESYRFWTQAVKKHNSRKARTYYRTELSKVMKDWEYDVNIVKHNRHDDRWNWD